MNLILASIGVFLGIILLLVVILLVAKQYLTPSGKVKITINGEKELEVEQGSTLLNTLSVNGIYLSSACGGKGSCGQCKCQVVEGGGEILPSEKGHFSRKQQQDHWTLFRVHTPRLRFLNLKWTTTRILTKTLSVRSICPHGKNSACSA